MKFGEKYELLESLTTGGVETFVANDKVRGERVLVHVLHCEPQKPNQPTVQWVLETFRKVAPEPVGLVLETGRYSGTLYAYLITKMPEEGALRTWVQQYKAQAGDTQEFPIPTPEATRESEAPTAELPARQPEHIPGPVTQLFRDFNSPPKPDTPNPTGKEPQPLSPPRPAVPPIDRSPLSTTAPWDKPAPRVSDSPKAEPRISSGDSFLSDFTGNSFPPQSNTPAMKDTAKPGEFTSFFQSPFRVEGPSEIPAISPQETKPPQKTVGDFTATFGQAGKSNEESSPQSGAAGKDSPRSGFTGWFNDSEIPSRTSSTTAPPPPVGLPRNISEPPPIFAVPPLEPIVPPPPPAYVAPASPALPAPPPPSPAIPKLPASAPSVLPSSLPSDNATRAFSRPGIEPIPTEPPPPSGPSAYTQIISAVKPTAAPQPSTGTPKSTPPKPLSFPAPSMPSMPAMGATPPLHMPPAPPMPAIAIPPPPPAPKLAAAGTPQPPVSYWPLVLTLTVLFFIAVLLVLFFALRH